MYFTDHGISNEEIDLMGFWGYFRECYDLLADQNGLDYAKKVTNRITPNRVYTQSKDVRIIEHNRKPGSHF